MYEDYISNCAIKNLTTKKSAVDICYIREYTVCIRTKLDIIYIQLYIKNCAIIQLRFCADTNNHTAEICYILYIVLSECIVCMQVK